MGSSGGSGDYSAYWAFFIDANFGNGEGKPTSIVSNIPGFGQAYFGNVNGMWGFLIVLLMQLTQEVTVK